MEGVNECLKCIELKKSLQGETKRVSQKNRLITLLRELVRSYEAKDLNLTFTDLSRIYESSSSEVTILKQRLTLYLNENQELLQLKNDLSSRNELLEKKCREVEDEISHLKFVNKQLGDYYREKETDHDQYKDRLKKLAKKLLNYEPKNSEARKILNLQNVPIDLEPKLSKTSNRKKNEESVKEMKKDKMGDVGLSTMEPKSSDIFNSEELDVSDSDEDNNDTNCNETSVLGIEEDSNPPDSMLNIDSTEVNTVSDNSLTSKSSCDKSNSENLCETISSSGDGVVTCEESSISSNCVDNIDHCTFYKNISKDTSSFKVPENKSKSSEVLPSIFEEESCASQEMTEQNEIDSSQKESSYFLEFEDSLPNLISPLKSDEPRALSYLECDQTLQEDSVVQDNSDTVESNQEVTESVEENEKESNDIKNECSSNSGDQIGKNKKSGHSTFQSKYQTFNGGVMFTEKPVNDGHIPLNGNFTPNYQFQSSHCFGCCNNNFDSRSPVTLKLYNCSNVEISIPPVTPNHNLPIITVRNKCDQDKCCASTFNGVKEPTVASAVHCSVNPERRSSPCDVDCNNQCIPTVLTRNKSWINRSTHISTESVKGPFNIFPQVSHGKPHNHDYYFSDYLSKNKVSETSDTIRKQWFDESERDTIKSNRLFPIKAIEQFDLEQFCYRFGSLSLKYSFSEEASKFSTSEKKNSSNKFSSLFNLSQPPVFHNSLKSSISSNNKNEWVFGQNFLNGAVKQDIPNKTNKSNNLLSKAILEKSPNKIKRNIVQKSVLGSQTNHLNRKNMINTIKNKISGNDSVQNPFHKVHEINEFRGTKDCFQPANSEVNSKRVEINKKGTTFESRPRMLAQCIMKQPVDSYHVPNDELNQMPLRNNSDKSLTSKLNETKLSEASKKECVVPLNNKDCAKSIFDPSQGKDVLAGNMIAHSNISKNKTKCIPTPQVLSQEKVIPHPLQNPSTSMNSLCSSEKASAEVGYSSSPHKPQTKEPLKETLPRQKPSMQKSKSPKNVKNSELSQSKHLSANHDDLFKKPDSVNIKVTSNLKNTEKKLECSKPIINKEVKNNLTEKSQIDSPKKIEQLSKLNIKKSSADIKKPVNKKLSALQNKMNEEPKVSTGSILKPDIKHVTVACKKSINTSRCPVADEEEDKKIDDELQTIFKEMKHDTVPLLGPLAKTPEISAEETPEVDEVMEIVGSSVENSGFEKHDNTVKSKKKCTATFAKEVEDENINSSLEKPVVDKENPSKCDMKDNGTISEPKQSSIFDESRHKMFDDDDDDDEEESLADETVMHSEDPFNNILEDKLIEDGEKNVENSFKNEVFESDKTEIFIKNEETKPLSCSKKEKAAYNINEAENDVPYTSLSEYKYNISGETTSTSSYNCQDVEPLAGDEEVEHKSSNDSADRPVFLGFYVNRSDEEITPNATVTSTPEIPKIECSDIANDPSPNNINDAPKEISSSDACNQENNSMMETEEAHEESKLHLEKEECLGNKRKVDETNDHVEGMCSKKQKMFSDDEYISCESDVFICALRYLSAAAVASFDGKSCLFKPNPDLTLATKIAINHIKNLIVEAMQSTDGNFYNVLNSYVKKIRQVYDASPTTLAKSILELISESNDNSEAKDKPYMPNMTKTVKMCLLFAVSFVGYNRDFVMKFCEVFEQYISSFFDKTLQVAEGSQLVIFYTSFCRSYNLDDKVKYLIYDVLYTRNIKAYPLVFKAIQTWPDIFPHSDTCFRKDCLLTQTIIFILLSGTSVAHHKGKSSYCIDNIKTYLFKYFGYKCNAIRREELTDKIIGNLTAKGVSIALVLLCKCEPWDWSLNILEKKLLPILQSPKPMDESAVCEYVLTVGRIVRGFPITKAAHIVKNTLEIFERMLLESNSPYLSEIIIEAISLLRRHNLLKCTSILMNWKPNTKQITKNSMNHINSILRVKNIEYWKNVYSAHSSNVIHNTRTNRKKKKSGSSVPP